MKATVIAIDFVKDIDGSFKALELNTNVSLHPLSQSAYLDTSKVTDFITSNSITNFEYIGTGQYGDFGAPPNGIKDLVEPNGDHNTTYGPRAFQGIKDAVSASIDYNDNLIQLNATTVPYLEDTSDTLIFRNAYDSSAVIDTTYGASSLAFLEFVSIHCVGDNAVDIPKTFIAPSGSEGQVYGDMVGLEPVLDTINNDELRDNGVHPNYIIKLSESTVDSDYFNYPKLVKVTSSAQMLELKESLDGSVILQEYVYNPSDLVDGKAKTYRMVAAIAGPELEVLDFYTPYFASNKLATVASPDFNNEYVQPWERPAYVQKLNSAAGDQAGKFLGDTVFLKEDGTEAAFSALAVGDSIGAISLTDLDPDELSTNLQAWSGSYSGVLPGEVGVGEIEDIQKSTQDLYNVVYVLKHSGGELVVGEDAFINTVGDGVVKFKTPFEIQVGDNLLAVDSEGNDVSKEVTSIKQKIIIGQSGTLDIETIDVAQVKGTEDNVYFAIHNKVVLCVCFYCSTYSYGASACLSNGCYASPGCSSSYVYCAGYATNTGSGCVSQQK